MTKESRSRGFTLLEIIVAIGVGGIVMFAVSNILRNTAKDVAALGAKNDFNQFISELQGVFNNVDRCQAAFTSTASIIPSLTGLVDPSNPAGPHIEIALNTGNTNPAKGPLGTPYKQGTKWGSTLTILNFELTGKVQTDAAHHKAQYSIPLHVRVSRRSGVTTEADTDTDTATLTTTSTSTDTSTDSSTATAASVLPTGFRNKKGSTTASGGDILQKTFLLTVTMDTAGSKIIGCNGQVKEFWQPTTHSQTTITTGTGTATHTVAATSLDIIYGAGAVFIADAGFSTATDTAMATHPAKLAVGGTLQSSNYHYRSDARLKENVREIPGALERISRLRGVEFDWREGQAPVSEKDQLGFLAQDVEQVFPEAVVTDPGSGLKSVEYENLLAPLVEALKERQKTLEQSQRDLDEIRKSLAKRK